MSKKPNKVLRTNSIHKDFSYPNNDDEGLQSKIFNKREFYYHRIPSRKKLDTYEEVKMYRDDACKRDFELREQQAILSNLINPNTPYNGVLIMHGTGTGKTCSAIAIAEQFKEQVKKYNTKIYVLVPGTNTREGFKDQLLFCTGDTYLKNKELFSQITKEEAERERKMGIYSALQYYKIMSYKTFYKKVLGEKIVEKKLVGDKKIKKTYRRDMTGDFERELVVDRITTMDNSILIVDEAHNLTGNEYGEALRRIIKRSKNIRVVLLTATPMKNVADDIIDLLNFVRPPNDQMRRDKIFSSEKNYMMKFKPEGLQYLKKMANGYVSYFRGSMPFTFAKRIDKGDIPEGLLFTPVIRCYMEQYQLKYYLEAIAKVKDTLDTSSSAASNFVFPGLSSDKTKLVGFHSTDGLNRLLSQISSDKSKLTKLINKTIFKGKLTKQQLEGFLIETENKSLSGLILNLDFLRFFSIKFYKAIKRLGKLVEWDKGLGTAFIYSKLVKAGGMELFSNALIENGYLEYQENENDYDIQSNTLDYRTGKTYQEYLKSKLDISLFKPATFILVTGAIDESGEEIPEIKQRIIREVFNNAENKDGKFIKFVLGSRVMTEGVTLENVKEVHILDVNYNVSRVEQIIGRAIRFCKHQAVITDEYRYPHVNVYRYVASTKKGLSTDETLYQKAELKYLLVNKVEKALKEVALDCPLLLHGNKFPEEIEKHKGCVYPTLENRKKGKKICPAMCHFEECNFKCDNTVTNKKYWNTKKLDYKQLEKKDINYNTFNDELARFEINSVKDKIKDLFRFKYVYLYNEMLNIIKKSYKKHQAPLFDEYFLDQALEELMPKSENDFNNFTDNVYDKYNKSGYLIQRGKYYIYQPFNEKEKVPLYYRKRVEIPNDNLVPIVNYLSQHYKDIKEKQKVDEQDKKIKKKGYNFDSTMSYYDERDDHFIVGIIDKNLNKLASLEDDLFKIRPKRSKILDVKRGTGIPTLKGAVCSTSKDKKYLLNLITKLNVNKDKYTKIKKMTRENICYEIRNKLLYLEKYATSKDKNKITYMIIPANHPVYPFPFNLEDRIKYIVKQVKNIVKRDIDIVTKKMRNGIFLGSRNTDLNKYQIEIKNDKYMKENENEIKKLGFKLENKMWIIIVE